MDPMTKKREDLKTLLGELKDFQEEYKGGKVPDTATAEGMDAKAKEAESLQDELDAFDKRVKNLERIQNRGTFDAPGVPDDQPDFVKTVDQATEKVVGYMRLGDFAVAQGGLKAFNEQGKPRAQFKLADVPTLLRGKSERDVFVPLTKNRLDHIMQTKAVPTIGAGVIDPMRVADLVRVTEHDQLRLRDILNISQTSSSAVEWVRLTNYTRAADPTAHGAQKPEADLTLDLQNSPVRTVAVWMPVQDQQLDDLPMLQNLINVEMLYDLEKRLEELVCWGDGVGLNFLGFFNDPAIWACGQMDAAGTTRVVAGEPLLDTIRRGITDVRVAGYSPNGVLVHPYDWETIQLTKGTDNHYVYVVVTEAGVSRLWGVPVIETEACQDFQGNATEERNLLVGDFTRGATLWDRMQSQIDVGWINDQFIRNMRTIRGEFRAAWGIRRPGAFRDFVTQAAVES